MCRLNAAAVKWQFMTSIERLLILLRLQHSHTTKKKPFKWSGRDEKSSILSFLQKFNAPQSALDLVQREQKKIESKLVAFFVGCHKMHFPDAQNKRIMSPMEKRECWCEMAWPLLRTISSRSCYINIEDFSWENITVRS